MLPAHGARLSASEASALAFPRLPGRRQATPGSTRSQEDHRLETRNLKALSAAGILALDEIVAPQHIVPGFGKSRAILFVRVTWKLRPFCAHQPPNLVSFCLMTKQARESGRFQSFILVKKIALIHILRILAGFVLQLHMHLRTGTPCPAQGVSHFDRSPDPALAGPALRAKLGRYPGEKALAQFS